MTDEFEALSASDAEELSALGAVSSGARVEDGAPRGRKYTYHPIRLAHTPLVP